MSLGEATALVVWLVRRWGTPAALSLSLSVSPAGLTTEVEQEATSTVGQSHTDQVRVVLHLPSKH